jgi:hypothetical protein
MPTRWVAQLLSNRSAMIGGLTLATVLAGPVISHSAHAATEPATTGGPAKLRRLSEAQYVRSIEDAFGAGIKVPGRFDPPLRDEGLLAIGDGSATISASGLEQDELRAREISAQVLAEDRRKTVMPCAPQSPDSLDKACARAFLSKYGRLLYRRPLSDAELASVMNVSNAATKQSHSFYKGMEIGLSRLLASPNFIFRSEGSEPDPSNPGVRRLDDYSLASRISFLLWDAPPDAQLLDAVAQGKLRDQKDLDEQVDRMIASPRFEQGVRAFFSDMLAYDEFESLSKDQAIYPKFTSQVAKDAKEQSLRTIVDLLVTNKGDYRDLFTTKRTFMNRNLGSLYQVALDDAGVTGWTPYTFAPDDPRAGILTLAAFLMLDPTHEGKTSPTIRGKSVRELLLCQKVPAPPGNVDFSKFEDPKNPNATVRERLTAHRDNPTCAGCHGIMDPIGLSAENYDAIGSFRTHEKGALIDASGKFEGKSYEDLIGFEQVLHDGTTASNCAVERVYEYGVGRPVTASEKEWLKYTDHQFADSGYTFPGLMRQVATGRAFRAVAPDSVASATKPVASKSGG